MKPRNNYLLTTKTKYIVSMLERLYYQSHIELLHARATIFGMYYEDIGYTVET
jgi:hypothetical protein